MTRANKQKFPSRKAAAEYLTDLGWWCASRWNDDWYHQHPSLEHQRRTIEHFGHSWTITASTRTRDGYDFGKNKCDRCGITKEERDKKPPMATGIFHPVYSHTKSFSLDTNGGAWCPECHKELELESVFRALDRRRDAAGLFSNMDDKSDAVAGALMACDAFHKSGGKLKQGAFIK